MPSPVSTRRSELIRILPKPKGNMDSMTGKLQAFQVLRNNGRNPADPQPSRDNPATPIPQERSRN